MRSRHIFGMLLMFSFSAHAQRMSPVDDIVRSWFKEGRPGAAAAFLDATIRISHRESSEEKIRLLLLSAVAHAENKEEVFEWTGFRERLTYDDNARARIRSSIDLVLHDLRRAEGYGVGETGP